MAKMVDDAGFISLWLRGVPFLNPQFGDAGQMSIRSSTPAGYLASAIQRFTI